MYKYFNFFPSTAHLKFFFFYLESENSNAAAEFKISGSTDDESRFFKVLKFLSFCFL